MPDGTTTVMTPAMLVENYIALRDKIKEIKDAHKAQLKPYNEMQARLEAVLLDELERHDLDSMRAAAGTVYKAISTSVSVDDWSAALEFIRERELWDMLEARVSKTAALAVIEENHAPIPGVKVSQVATVHVRRA